MKLLTKSIHEKLLNHGKARQDQSRDLRGEDFVPVVKLFTPDANCTWLLTELDPQDPDIAFGLCDLGMGCPELGYVSIKELVSVRGPLGLAIERDRHFQTEHTLSTFTSAARSAGAITECPQALKQAANAGDAS